MRILLAIALVLSASAEASAAAELTWREKAQRDLAAMRVAIEDSHPGAADTDNPNFRAWLYDGYFKALGQVGKVQDYGGYAALLRFYANGFKDVHMSISTSGGPKPRTPGFLTTLKNGEFTVASRVNLEAHAPPVGSTLISCDGKSAMMVAHDNLDPYFTVTQLNAHRWQSAPYLFVDDHNPFIVQPRACTFRLPGPEARTQEYVLEWRDISSGALTSAVNGILDWTPNLGVRKVGSMYWVTLPDMTAPFDNPQYMDIIYDLRDKAEAIRSASAVVIDVRSNSGGRVEWGTAIANEIWGADYVRSRSSDATLDARVSATTVSFIDKSWKSEEGYARLQGWVPPEREAFKSAYTAKRTWVTLPVYPGAGERGRKVANPVRGKVVLLTDNNCVSACLMFADLLFDLGDVLHVGQPTNADTQYTYVRDQTLESKNATLHMPNAVFRRRKRGANQTYVPKHVFRGEISDTWSIQAWVQELPEMQKNPKVAVGDEQPAKSRAPRGRKR